MAVPRGAETYDYVFATDFFVTRFFNRGRISAIYLARSLAVGLFTSVLFLLPPFGSSYM